MIGSAQPRPPVPSTRDAGAIHRKTRHPRSAGHGAEWINACKGGPKADKAAHFPTLIDGLKGVAFIEAAVRSSARGGRWVSLPR